MLTDVAHKWLNSKFNEHKTRYGVITEEKIATLYVPTEIPSKYPREFQIELKPTYYNNSYFNPPVQHGVTLASGPINLFLGPNRIPSIASSKRYAANSNNPRLFTDDIFKAWKLENFNKGDFIQASIESSNAIWLRK